MYKALVVVTDYPFDGDDRRLLLDAIGPNGKLEMAADVAELRRLIPGATVLCSMRLPDDLPAIAPNLRWLHYPMGGIDDQAMLRGDIPFAVTTVSSANAASIAEYVFGSMLIFARKWYDMWQLQMRKEWASGRVWGGLRGVELQGQTIGIIGMGAIGRRVAQIARVMRMRTLGLRRTSHAGESDTDCDAVFGPGQLHDLLGQSDFVLVSVPLTPETTGLIGARELRAMRSNAYLVNVARGEVIDQNALVRALRERWIAGAGLDVVTQEPLPASSPLWTATGVVLTPHLSGLTIGYSHRVAEHFAANLRRFQRDEPLVDRVDLARGY